MLQTVAVDGVAARRATRTKARDTVFVARVGAEAVAGADGDRGRLDTGVVNSTVDLLSFIVFTDVPGGRHDDYPGIDQLAHSLAQRIVFVRIDRPRAEAHVYYANVVGVLIG